MEPGSTYSHTGLGPGPQWALQVLTRPLPTFLPETCEDMHGLRLDQALIHTTTAVLLRSH